MFEYVITLKTKIPGEIYHTTIQRPVDNIHKVRTDYEKFWLGNDFVWTDEEYMVRTNHITAFHVHRLPTLQEKHDEAEEYILAYLKMYHPYESFTIDDLVNTYRKVPVRELEEKPYPIFKAVLNLGDFLKPISEYQEEQNK